MTNYSVLMSVYRGENAENFWQSVQSVLNQPFVTNDFVIVCDGPLTWELDAVLEKITAEYDSIVNVIRLPENVGIGAAANIGLQACQNELVAKMDSDDIAVYGRFALQCDCFEQNEQLSVLGGYIEEFDDDPDKPVAVREVPVANEEIRQMARRRQPFNNTTVMYRKSAVIAVGGYRNFRRNEDYDLYVRLLHAGYYTQNLEFEMLVTRPVIYKTFEIIFSRKLKTLTDGVTDRFRDAIYELRSKALINKGIIQAPKGKGLITRNEIDIDKITEKKKSPKKAPVKSTTNKSKSEKEKSSTKTTKTSTSKSLKK